jgi:hypothetical protein
MYTILCGKVLYQTFQSQNCSNSQEIMNGPKYTHSPILAQFQAFAITETQTEKEIE